MEPEDLDEGFFTPVASTSLANIFRTESLINNTAENATLKYQPPQQKEKQIKAEAPKTLQCAFSCSVIAYEYTASSSGNQQTSRGKVGFAFLRNTDTNSHKMILYNSDKSTLSHTTVSSHLEVTLKGRAISFNDNNGKYWGICFDHTSIKNILKILQEENVIIKNDIDIYHQNRQQDENYEVSFDENDQNVNESFLGTAQGFTFDKQSSIPPVLSSSLKSSDSYDSDNESFNTVNKLTLNRIANVGRAVLPILQSKKQTNQTDIKASPVKAHSYLSSFDLDVNTESQAQENQSQTDHLITIEGGDRNEKSVMEENHEAEVMANLSKIPQISNTNHFSADAVYEKLEQIRDIVKNVGPLEEVNEELRHQVKKKDDEIKRLKYERDTELKKNMEFLEEKNKHIHYLNNKIDEFKQQLDIKDIIPKDEVDNLIASKVKALMNNTYQCLASNIESENTYSGSYIKSMIATVIKRNTLESLSSILTGHSLNISPSVNGVEPSGSDVTPISKTCDNEKE